MLNIAWAVLVLALAGAPLAAADIQGRVLTVAGHSIDKPVWVRLLIGDKAVEEEFTDFSGRFRFRKIAAGSYSIRVECDGYQQQDIPVTMSNSNYHVTITLQAIPIASGFSGTFDPFAEMEVPVRAQKEFDLGVRELKKASGCDKALPHFQKAVALYAKYGDAVYAIGTCYRKTGNLQGAEESFKQAMALNRKIDAVISLADMYFSQQRFDDGRNLIIPMLPQYPTEGDLYAALARNYFAVGRIREAESAALDAQSRTHKSADVHLLLAKIYENQHNRAAVITQLRDYLDESGPGPMTDTVNKQLRDLTGEP